MPGDRFNAGKPLLGCVSPDFVAAIGAVMTSGAVKYGRNNWMGGLSYSETTDSLLRHLTAWQRGETTDGDSGLPHLWHVACNAMFLIHFETYRYLYEEYDDRAYTPVAVAQLADVQPRCTARPLLGP